MPGLPRISTDSSILFCKDVYQGINISSWVNFAEISSKYAAPDNSYILDNLAVIRSAMDLHQFANSLEPKNLEYLLLKMEIRATLQSPAMVELTYHYLSKIPVFVVYGRWGG
jgi:hypothetical protein